MLEEDRDGIKWNEFVQDFYDIRNEAPFFWKIFYPSDFIVHLFLSPLSIGIWTYS